MSNPSPHYVQPWPPSGPPAQPTAPKARGRVIVPILTGVVGLALGAGIGGSNGGSSSTSATSTITRTIAAPPVSGAKAAKSKPPAAAPAATIPGDGTFLVGSDVKPGTYRSRPAEGGGGLCYWARLADTAGGDIIANELGKGSQIVTIKATDKAFKTNGCEDWTKV
jgi:hypothetical protein